MQGAYSSAFVLSVEPHDKRFFNFAAGILLAAKHVLEKETIMILGPANYFQLYGEEHADFALGANGDKLSREEEYLWLNVELYAKVIKAAGLQDKLQAAYEQALKDYAQNATERFVGRGVPAV
jgi:hypothetical protein